MCSSDLYQLSKDAGLHASFPMWRDHVGSVMCIDFSKQVSMGLTEYPGLLGATTFSYIVDVTLLSTDGRPNPSYTLYTVIVEPSLVTIKNQSMDIQTGTTQLNPTLLQTQYKRNDERVFNPYGGINFDDFRRFGRKVGSVCTVGSLGLRETV